MQKLVGLKIGWFQFNFENSDWNIARLINYKDIINEIENYYWLQFNFAIFFFLKCSKYNYIYMGNK